MHRDPSPFLEHCKRTGGLPCPCGSGRGFDDCCRRLAELLEASAGGRTRRRLWLVLMLCWFPHLLGPPAGVRARVARRLGRRGPPTDTPCWLLAVLPGPDCPPEEPVVALDRLLRAPWRDGRSLLRCLEEPGPGRAPGQSARSASRASTVRARRTGTRQAARETATRTAPTAK